MADLNLTIGVDATQYNQGLQQAGRTATQTASVMSQAAATIARTSTQAGGAVAAASNRGAYALTNLSRVAQDAPFGFIAIQNNISPLVDSFGALVRESGSVGGALRSLTSSLIGPAGIGLAIAVATSAITYFIQSQQGAKKAIDSIKDSTDAAKSAFKTLDDSYATAVKNVDELRINVKLAKDGFISKKDVVKEYNDTLGKTIGQVKTLDQVEQSLTKNADAYIQMMLYKAAATSALTQAAEKAVEIAKKQATPDEESAPFILSGLKGGKYDADYKRSAQIARDEATKEDKKDKTLLESIAADFQKKAAEISKKSGFKSFLGDEKTDSSKQAKTGFELLQDQIKKIEDELENSIIAGKTTSDNTDTPLVRKLNAAKKALEDYKASFDKVQQGLPSARNTKSTGNVIYDSIGRGLDIAGVGGKKFGQPDDLKNMQKTVKAMNDLNNLRASGSRGQKEYNDGLKDEQKTLQGITNVIGGGLTNAFASALSGGQSFFSAMGQFLVQLIERLIAAAAAAAILAALLSVTSFGSSAAAGAASFGGLFGQLSGLKGLIPGHADGGITSRAHLAMVGEGREREAIMPLSKLNQFVQTNGGGMADGKIVGILRGPDLLLQYQRAQKSKSRTS